MSGAPEKKGGPLPSSACTYVSSVEASTKFSVEVNLLPSSLPLSRKGGAEMKAQIPGLAG